MQWFRSIPARGQVQVVLPPVQLPEFPSVQVQEVVLLPWGGVGQGDGSGVVSEVPTAIEPTGGCT
jgi:hypothetical protein